MQPISHVRESQSAREMQLEWPTMMESRSDPSKFQVQTQIVAQARTNLGAWELEAIKQAQQEI